MQTKVKSYILHGGISWGICIFVSWKIYMHKYSAGAGRSIDTHTHTLLLNTILIIVQCIIYMSWNRTVILLHWIPPPPILPLTLSNSKCWPKGNLSQSYCYYIINYNYFHNSRRKGRERDTKSSSSCTVRQILSKIRFIFDIQPPSLK